VRSLVVCLHQIVGVNLPASHLARSAQGASLFGLTQRPYSIRALRSLFADRQIEIFPKVLSAFPGKILTNSLDLVLTRVFVCDFED
jgi:uncharacterized membrane protein